MISSYIYKANHQTNVLNQKLSSGLWITDKETGTLCSINIRKINENIIPQFYNNVVFLKVKVPWRLLALR